MICVFEFNKALKIIEALEHESIEYSLLKINLKKIIVSGRVIFMEEPLKGFNEKQAQIISMDHSKVQARNRQSNFYATLPSKL
jgi:hypothetical protein